MEDLQTIYRQRFAGLEGYRRKVWQVLLSDFFQPLIGDSARVLDLGCGYCEFINLVQAREKYGMDLNPDSAEHLDKQVRLLRQDCSEPWPLPDNALDAVFASNFFEHLPDKAALSRTLDQVRRCLRPSGRLIALGPNINCVPGAYWDFWDHYVPLTELSLSEALHNRGFGIERCWRRFLPYTMARGREYPLWMLRVYLKLPLAWRLFGKQFLVVAVKPQPGQSIMAPLR